MKYEYLVKKFDAMKPGVSNTFFFTLFILSALILGSCGSDNEVSGGSLTGRIGGEQWSMHFGSAFQEEPDPSKDPQIEYSSSFYSSAVTENNPCEVLFPGSDVKYLTFRVPGEVGTYSLPPVSGIRNSVQFISGPGNFNGASSGQVEVTSVTSTSISGRMTARFDDDNFVQGRFTLQVCESN